MCFHYLHTVYNKAWNISFLKTFGYKFVQRRNLLYLTLLNDAVSTTDVNTFVEWDGKAAVIFKDHGCDLFQD
jgi:hypothetical protein